jgi:hypothetical protein
MEPRLLFPLSSALAIVAWSMVAARYAWPRLRALPRETALTILAVPHTFRFVGLSFLVPGVVSPSLPRAFAVPAAYGDLITALLALAATIALPRRWWWGVPVAWIMNVWGAVDLLYATYAGIAVDLDAGMLGAAFFIPTVLVPLLLVAHALSLRLLVARAVDLLRRHRLGDQLAHHGP